MIQGLGLLFLVLSAGVFFTAAVSKGKVGTAIVAAVAVNIFPVAAVPYIGNQQGRLFDIPISYLPYYAAFLGAIWVSGLTWRRAHVHILVASGLLLFVLALQAIFVAQYPKSTAAYWALLAFYLLGMVSTAAVVATLDSDRKVSVIKSLVLTLAFGAFVGVLRYASGVSGNGVYHDANFFPLVNRNTTAFALVVAMPLLLWLRDRRSLSRVAFSGILVTFSVAVVLLQSRMGLLVFPFAAAWYFVRTRGLRLKAMAPVVFVSMLLGFIVLRTPLGGPVAERLSTAGSAIELLGRSGTSLDAFASDYNRLKNLFAGVEVAKENFVTGTGLGLRNYLAEVRRLNPDLPPGLVLRSHNFYVSYLGEYGVVGFGILVAVFLMIFVNIRPPSNPPFESQQRTPPQFAFESIFIAIALMLFVNEYVNSPLLWGLLGLMLGVAENGRERGYDMDPPRITDTKC